MEGPEKNPKTIIVFLELKILIEKNSEAQDARQAVDKPNDLQNKFLCTVALPERAGWVEALDCEGWVGEGLGNGGHLGPVLRCCHPS